MKKNRKIIERKIDPFKEIAQGISQSTGENIWEEEPVSIQKFIEDKKFLNLKWKVDEKGKGSGCRPLIMEIAKKVVHGDIREVMLLLGKGCLTGDMIIWTRKGPKKMSSLEGKIIEVQSRDENNKEIWNLGLCLDRGLQEVKRYTFSNGMWLDATDNHNIDVPGKGKIKISDMKIGDYIAAPRKLLDPIEETKWNDPYLYRLVGLLLGDGTISSYKIGLSVSEDKVRECYNKCVEKVDPEAVLSDNNIFRYVCLTHEAKRGHKGERVKFYSIFKELGLIGKKAKNKFIPKEMMKGSIENIKELLAGLFSTDGWIEMGRNDSGNGTLPYVFYCSKSKKMLRQIKFLLSRIGICATFHYKQKSVKLSTWKNHKWLWGGGVEISGYEDVKLFLDNVDILRPNANEAKKYIKDYTGLSMKPNDQVPISIAKKCGMKLKGKSGVARYRFNREVNGKGRKHLNIHWCRLIKIEDKGLQKTYDIICQGDNHNYCANGLYPENSGKDFLATILPLYGIYKALCLYSPQKYYGLSPGSPIYFVNTARNDKQAKLVFFTEFKGMLLNCPWFEGKFQEPGVDSITFEKNIKASSANSQAFGWLGFNVLQWVGDELAFFLTNDEDEESASRAEDCWEAAFGSCTTRFRNHYKMIGITTPRYDDDFVMRKFFELKGRPDSFVEQKATWDINPNLTKADFKYALERNQRRTMRDFGAEPVGVIESFWANPDFIDDNVCEECRICEIWQSRDIQANDYCCLDYKECKANPYRGNGSWNDTLLRTIVNTYPDADYYLHFDLSKNKDILGIAMCHVVDTIKVEMDGFQLKESLESKDTVVEERKKEQINEDNDEDDRQVIKQKQYEEKTQVDKASEDMDDMYEEKALIKVDFIMWLNPLDHRDPDMMRNREIYYTAIENRIVRYLINSGFKIAKITFDSFQSHHLKQRLNDWGIETDLLSLDRNDEVPVKAKNAFVENRVIYHWDKKFAMEARHLKWIKGKKVDHARSLDKATCDAVFGCVYSCDHSLDSGTFVVVDDED